MRRNFTVRQRTRTVLVLVHHAVSSKSMSLTLCLLLLCLGASAAHHVWPPPKSIAVAGARLPLSAEFAFALGDGAVGASASRLPAAMAKIGQTATLMR